MTVESTPSQKKQETAKKSNCAGVIRPPQSVQAEGMICTLTRDVSETWLEGEVVLITSYSPGFATVNYTISKLNEQETMLTGGLIQVGLHELTRTQREYFSSALTIWDDDIPF